MNVQTLLDLDEVDLTNLDHRSKILAHAELKLRATGWAVVDKFDKVLKHGTRFVCRMDIEKYANTPTSGEEVAAKIHEIFVAIPIERLGTKLLRTVVEIDQQAGTLLFSTIMVPA